MITKRALCALFDFPRCPHVSSQQDDRDKRHQDIIIKSSASVTRGIIAVHNDIHNVPVGCPPQKYRCRYHRRDPVVASEPDAGDAQNPYGQVGEADFSLERASCRPPDIGSGAIGKKDVSNKADKRSDPDAYHQEGEQKHLDHAVFRPRLLVHEKVENRDDNADKNP